jgi:hypothetical protein
MSKSWIALAFLPFVAACAGTPGAQLAQRQCQAVAQDNTDSHIKVKNECASTEGSSVDPHQSQAKPAPQ